MCRGTILISMIEMNADTTIVSCKKVLEEHIFCFIVDYFSIQLQELLMLIEITLLCDKIL